MHMELATAQVVSDEECWTMENSVALRGAVMAPIAMDKRGSMEARKLCAYNQTRECFLGLEVVGADLAHASLAERIKALGLRSGG